MIPYLFDYGSAGSYKFFKCTSEKVLRRLRLLFNKYRIKRLKSMLSENVEEKN